MNNQNQLSAAFADAVVRARLRVEELAERHIEAAERLATVRSRIDEIEAERARRTAGRKPGESIDDATAGRVYMLGLDLETLKPMLAEASEAESAANSSLASARCELAAAEQTWRRHQNETLLASLRERAGQVEQLLFDILADMTAVGARLGKPSLTSVYAVSNDLRNLAVYGQVPGRGFR